MNAEAWIHAAVGAGSGQLVSLLSTALQHVIKKTWLFKSNLKRIQNTIKTNKPTFDDIDRLIGELDRPLEEKQMFINQLKGAEALVLKCLDIKCNFYKMYTHSLKLEELDASLLRFCQIPVSLLTFRAILDLQVAKSVKNRMKKGDWSGRSSGVPLLEGGVITFSDRVRALKAKVLKDSAVDDCSVVVVSAGGGWGKTTLVTMLCHDREVKDIFGRNIYFATISETPDLKIVVKKLLGNNQAGQQLDFDNDNEAIQTWGRYLGEIESEVLLVLDDVWKDDIIKRFMFKRRGYKILVTSRSTFEGFQTHRLQLLNDQDAIYLFRHLVFSEFGSQRTDIPDELVDKLVKCCKNHPLSLNVVGGLLKGRHIAIWDDMLKNLSQGKQSLLDLNEEMLLSLGRSLDVLEEESVIKQCYLDVGLFPEDQKISATTLMDMWVHLYNHDKEGFDTINQVFELSYKNLAILLPISKGSTMVANWCEEKVVMQHDLMRTLAIRLSSQGPVEHRKRLIIDANGKDPTPLPQIVNARILSISTDEIFFPEWEDIQAPKVEVFVLNFMSKICALPRFMQSLEKLKVLIITNYGYYMSELENFPPPQSLSSLTSLRLDHVSISSVSTSILELVNLQKLSLIMCKIGNSFKESTIGIPNKLPSLVELDIDSCDDLVTYPAMLCNLLRLKKLSITNCHELTSLSEGFGNLINVEVLRLASCSNLTALPISIRSLQKLSIIDLSHCLSLHNLPEPIGELNSLQTIYVSGCTGLQKLPKSVKDVCLLKAFCDKEISGLWTDFPNVKVEVVEEDHLDTFSKITQRGYQY